MHILVVDDEKDIQMLFDQWYEKEISENLFEFHYFFSGDKALKWIENHPEIHSLIILTDIKMAGMDGFLLLKLLKNTYPDFPVFMLTAYGDETNFVTAKAFGANEFLTKPIEMEVLKQKLLSYKHLIENKVNPSS